MSNFERLLERHRIELQHALHNFEVWKTLENRDDETARVLNAFRGFFNLTIEAIKTQFVINIMNIAGSDYRLPNVHRLLKMIDRDEALAPDLDTRVIRKRLKQLRPIILKLKTLRDRRAAHWDMETPPEDPTLGEVETILRGLETIFHEITMAAQPGHHWPLTYSEHSHTESFLRTLRESWAKKRAQ
ncbi:MAG: hypothetical protein IH861_11565 [Chloroflexi bacterium]|nr:hypothetical protein [Chloroflexota bacterium]